MARLLHYVVNALSDTLLADDSVPQGVQMANAPALWARGYTGRNVVVAVIDSGADYSHPDFRRKFYPPINFSGSRSARDDNGHGTHVTGTIGANGWLRGVAPNCRILPIKVFDADGSAGDAAIARAFRAAADWIGPNGERVNVINASFGGSADSQALHDSIRYAVGRGIIVVAAAGNEGDNNPNQLQYVYPGAYQEVVEVASVNAYGIHSEFSNVNEQVDVCCLGEAVQSTYPTYFGHRYAVFSGTSMATPHQSGICAIAYEMFVSIHGRRPANEDELWQFVSKNVKPLRIPKMEQGLGLGYLRPELLTQGKVAADELPADEAEEEAIDTEPAESARQTVRYAMYLRNVKRNTYVVQIGGTCRTRQVAANLGEGIKRRIENGTARIEKMF
ncbi:MAG: S8 family peptidase [Chloroflexota bacterium]